MFLILFTILLEFCKGFDNVCKTTFDTKVGLMYVHLSPCYQDKDMVEISFVYFFHKILMSLRISFP